MRFSNGGGVSQVRNAGQIFEAAFRKVKPGFVEQHTHAALQLPDSAAARDRLG
jgi:N-acyl-D-aspartate/D-glutamate deacylase